MVFVVEGDLFVKISVISDSAGKIVAASYSIPNAMQPAGNKGAADKVAVPAGHRVHEVTLPPDLANEVLSGNFARAMSHCTLEIKGKKATLTPKAPKKH
jgi:hypothetical protein